MGPYLIVFIVNRPLCGVACVRDAERIGAEYTMIRVQVIVRDPRVAGLCWRSQLVVGMAGA